MMTKNNTPRITCYADLEREEMRVKKRIQKHEEELKVRLKQLPEEVVTIGVAKVVSGIVSGNFLKTGMKILKKILSYFFGKKDGENASGGGSVFRNTMAQVFETYANRNK